MNTVSKKINEIINNGLPKNPIVIFDIDDTIINSKNGNPNLDVLNAYKITKLYNIDVAIITARKDLPFVISNTYKQLFYLGIDNTPIFFMPRLENDVALYKHTIRKNITNNGYNIIASIGDCYWDLGSYCMNNIHIINK